MEYFTRGRRFKVYCSIVLHLVENSKFLSLMIHTLIDRIIFNVNVFFFITIFFYLYLDKFY